jgi:CelD/BcsL family acetyltransferase involved in cellulose biosynthesis
MPIHIELCRDPAIFSDLAAEWSALLCNSAVDTIFLTPQWQGVWWKHFQAGRDLRVLLARDDDGPEANGELVGIAPLYAVEQDGQTLLQFVGGVEISDYLDFIVMQGREEEVYRALMLYLRDEAPAWDLLDLHCLPGHSPTRAGLLCQACAECCSEDVQAQQEEAAPYIPLPDDWEVYLGTLDKKQRHEVRRKMRRAEAEAELHWYRVQEAAQLDSNVEHFLALHRASHPEKDAFMTPQMEGFFREMARVIWEQGWLDLYLLWLDGRPAATMWCFDYNNDLLVYNSGYDPTWRYELSSGIVLLSYCIQEAIARGKQRFDFMRGDEVYKYRFGAVEGAVYRLVVRKHPS